MSRYSLSHVSDRDLLSNLASLVTQDWNTTAELLAHIAEVDARRLYVPAGFPSMFLYSVHELHLSEDCAYKRILAARTARQFPAHVRRAVWERDEGRCTFVSPTGQRCPARRLLEFDHLDPVALGGQATAERITLKCRAHNQYAAECAFGTEFMRHKREEARRARAEARAAAARWAAEDRERAAAVAEKAKELDVVPALRNLGFRADEARRAATHCDDTVPDSTIEERLRAALRFLSPPARRWSPAAGSRGTAP